MQHILLTVSQCKTEAVESSTRAFTDDSFEAFVTFFEPHDPSDLAPSFRTHGGGNRANKRLKNLFPRSLFGSEHGRDM